MSGQQEVPEHIRTRRVIQDAQLQAAPKTVLFAYVDASGNKSNREVEPYELRGDGPEAVLVGHCLDRQTVRQFKIGQMTDARVGSTFRPRGPIVTKTY